MARDDFYRQAETQPALCLPPNTDARIKAVSFLKVLLEDLPREKKLDTYVNLAECVLHAKNPHYAEFLLEIMDFLFLGFTDEQRAWLNSL